MQCWYYNHPCRTITNLAILAFLIHHLSFPLVQSSPQQHHVDLSITAVSRANGNGKGNEEGAALKTNSIDGQSQEELDAELFVKTLNEVFTSGINTETAARWDYITNITDHNEAEQVSNYVIVKA